MALATVTYNVWDANRGEIPAVNEPEVFFRPLMTSMVAGLISDREVPGTLDPDTGAGQVRLESAPGLLYVPIVTWLKNPDDPKNRARGQAEWAPFFPAQGGPIDQLPGVAPPVSGIWYGFGDPPVFLSRRDDVVYFDISGAPSGRPVLWIDDRYVVGGGA